MLKPIAIFFIVYFWISAMVYADTEPFQSCETEQRMGMVLDSDQRNPGCDKGLDLEELFNKKRGQEIA
jgi:hypothetical protein